MILRNWINKIIGVDGKGYVVQVKSTYGRAGQLSLSFSVNEDIFADNYTEVDAGMPGSVGIGVVLGSGTTPPTVDDYKMENAITENLNAGGVTRSFNANTSNSSLTVVQPIVNIGTNTITISEIGLFVKGYPTSKDSCILLSRDVIPPVIIAPNESKTFVVTIDFTQMSTSASAS